MLVTNHVLVGAAIGALSKSPGKALALGVASHFLCDMVPHWGKVGRDEFMKVAVRDGLTGLAVMGALTVATPRPKRPDVLAGMVGAALPDLDKPSREVFGRSPWPGPVNEFHSAIQNEAADRMGRETVMTVAGSALGLVLALRARRR